MNLDRYIAQLLEDISISAENASFPYKRDAQTLFDIPTEEEEDRFAQVRDLEEWTGIKQEYLPPASMLNDEQLSQLLAALISLLEAYNWMFVVQIAVPQRVQYETIRCNFKQDAKVKVWHMGFFEFCKPGTLYTDCVMGEYCHCSFFEKFFSRFEDEELSPEEERARMLEIEVQHIKRRYGDDWMKYYPYHLDPEYDDEYGNPYDYGMGDWEEDPDW